LFLQDNLAGANKQEFPVFKGMFLCPSRKVGVQMVLAEVPPSDDVPPHGMVSMDPVPSVAHQGAASPLPELPNAPPAIWAEEPIDDTTVIALEGLGHARKLLARLPSFEPPSLPQLH
jgi:hypothetical protein